MAPRQPANHTPAFKVEPTPALHETLPAITVGVPATPGKKHDALRLDALPHGGFIVMAEGGEAEFGRRVTLPLASFSTLPELLAWVGKNMAQPALEAA